MDIQKMINDAIEKLKSDDKLLENFKANPTKVLEKLVGIDLPDDKIDAVVKGIMAKLNMDQLADKASDLMGALGGLFGKRAEILPAFTSNKLGAAAGYAAAPFFLFTEYPARRSSCGPSCGHIPPR